MGNFIFGSRVDVSQPLGEPSRWRLDMPLVYRSYNQGLRVTVPAGFSTDFASVPWLFRRILPRSGEYNAAAIVHDYLYSCRSVPRKAADQIFLEAMHDVGVPGWKAKAMYSAVRLGGGRAYKYPPRAPQCDDPLGGVHKIT